MTTIVKAFTLFLAAVFLLALPGAPAQECAPCRMPEHTPRPTCTPASNPRKFTAGLPGMIETGSAGFYSWAPMGAPVAGYERVPMVRDFDDLLWQILPQVTVTNTVVTVGGNSDWLMLFNEPFLLPPAGSDMTIEELVLAQALIEALFPGRLLVSPAFSQANHQALEHVRDRFIQEYGRPPRWEALAFHCYWSGSAAQCTSVVDWHVAKAQEWGASEVWCTEFAALVSIANPDWPAAAASGSAFIDYMVDAGVDRFFWFGVPGVFPGMTSELVIDGTLTLTGEMYLNK